MTRVTRIVIVGGGTSGWMTAAYLCSVLPELEITLIESPAVPTIGVGEATFPFIRAFHRRIGIETDADWMPVCDATFKTGILYRDWLQLDDQYWHPLFEDLEYIHGTTHTGQCWLNLHRAGHKSFESRASFFDSCFASTTVNLKHHRIPCGQEHAYHFDAGKYLNVLKRVCRGLRHLEDTVEGVHLGSGGEITELLTQQSGRIGGDLFIDCSGFRRKLMGAVAPSNRFLEYSRSLFCDRAIVLHFPYANDEARRRQLQPYVTCSAQSAGWIWTIPLFSQISSGYVYSSSFVTPESAEAELRAYWKGVPLEGATTMHIRFLPGKLEQLWVNNCVAIGLAGGFLEPLESSGLAITQVGVEMLASMLDGRYFDDQMIGRYNGHLDKFYTDIFHFLIAHYAFSQRTDSPFLARRAK